MSQKCVLNLGVRHSQSSSPSHTESSQSIPSDKEQVPYDDQEGHLPCTPPPVTMQPPADESSSAPLATTRHQPNVQEPVVPRRSARSRAEPERLNIESWHGKSYDAVATQVGQVAHGPTLYGGQVYGPGPVGSWSYPAVESQAYPAPYSYSTAPNSVGHTYGLPLSVPGGGGGISGYGLPSNHVQSSDHTKYWPDSAVHNTGLSQLPPSYYTHSGWY